MQQRAISYRGLHEGPRGPNASYTKSPVPHCQDYTRLSECSNWVWKGCTKRFCPFTARNTSTPTANIRKVVSTSEQLINYKIFFRRMRISARYK